MPNSDSVRLARNVFSSAVSSAMSAKSQAVAQATVSGTAAALALALRLRPRVLRCTSTRRSSTVSRRRRTRPADSSRFNSGVKVLDSSINRSPISDTDIPSFSQSTSITKYCGYVTPNGSSSGWYTLVMANEAEYNAKQSC